VVQINWKIKFFFQNILEFEKKPYLCSRFERKADCKIAKIAQLVEHDLAKVGVAGSSPVFRSQNVFCPDGGMVDTKDLKSFGFTAVRVQVPLRVRF
jgi:hypothetical protein